MNAPSSFEKNPQARRRRMPTALVCALIAVAAVVLLFIIFSTEPAAKREGATRKSAMLVDVTTVQRETHRPNIRALGTVIPSREMELAARVAGEVVAVHPGFTPGAIVRQGEILVEIDAADYEISLQEDRSMLKEAEAELAVERGRRQVAEQDYALLKEDLDPEKKSLVLREPQLQRAEALVEAARAALRQAELNLKRTKVSAPFDARVLAREANLGSQVSIGEALAHLVSVDSYWVEATIPQSLMRHIEIPRPDETSGAAVQVRNRSAWPDGAAREGRVVRDLGNLDVQSRMVRLLVEVPDPLALKPQTKGPAMTLGAYVETHIEGRPLSNVVRLDRDYVHKNDTVWVMQDGTLDIRSVDIVFRDATHAYIGEGLKNGDTVVISALSTIVQGAALAVRGADEPAQDEGAGTTP